MEWDPPVIFKTSEFFGPQTSENESEEDRGRDTTQGQSVETQQEDNVLNPKEEPRDCTSDQILSQS